MLTQIDFYQFKCFRKLDLPLAGLTLLSGLNASGKSSILQALALLHQTMREHEWSSRLMLNGAAIRLGAAADVIDKLHGRRRCGIGLHDDERRRLRWDFEGEPEEMSLAVRRARGNTGAGNDWDVDGSQPLQYLIPRESLDDVTKPLAERIRGLAYLTARTVGSARNLYARRSAIDPRGRTERRALRQYSAFRTRYPRPRRACDFGGSAHGAAADRGAYAPVFSRLRTGGFGSSARQRRDAGPSDVERHEFPSPDSYRLRVDADPSYRDGRLVHESRGTAVDREPGSAPASGGASGDG